MSCYCNAEVVFCCLCRIEPYTVAHKLVPTTALLCMCSDFVYLSLQGDCITTASPSDVCGLNSFASRCDNSSATNCSCYSGYENEDEKNCRGIIFKKYVIIVKREETGIGLKKVRA